MRPDARMTPAVSAPTHSPHVAHIVGTLGAGGVQSLVLALAATPALREYRHSVVCLFGAEGRWADRFVAAGHSASFCPVLWPDRLNVGSHRVSKWVRERLAFTFPFRLAREVQRLGADLVHSHVSHRIDLQADGALRRAGLPMIWTIHSLYGPDDRELRRWRRATRLAATFPASIAVVAEEVARDFRARGLDHPNGIDVIRGGVDLSRFRPVAKDPAWRLRLGIPPDALVLGAAGRLVAQKGYDVFVRAAGRLVAERADVYFVIAGDGPLRESLQAEMSRAGLGSRFQLVGYESDVPAFLGQLDVFVLPSRFEGFPIALLEALAAGLPVIATSVGGVPEMLGERGGLAIPVESEEALVGAMRAMLDPAARSAYASKSREIAKRFSIERTAEGFATLYGRLMATGRRRRVPKAKKLERGR